jgi:hypothetical protein
MTATAFVELAQSGPAAWPRLSFARAGTRFLHLGLNAAALRSLRHQISLPRTNRIRPMPGHSGDHFPHSLEPAA